MTAPLHCVVLTLLVAYSSGETSLIKNFNQIVSPTNLRMLMGCDSGWTPIECWCNDECAGILFLSNLKCLAWATDNQAKNQLELKGSVYCIKDNEFLSVIPDVANWDSSETPAKCSPGRKIISCNFIDGRWFRSLDLEVMAVDFDASTPSSGGAYQSYFQAFHEPDDLRNHPSKWITDFKTSHNQRPIEGKTDLAALIEHVTSSTFDQITPEHKALIVVSDFIDTATNSDIIKDKLSNLVAKDWTIFPVKLPVPYVNMTIYDLFKVNDNLSWDLANGFPSFAQTEDIISTILKPPTTAK